MHNLATLNQRNMHSPVLPAPSKLPSPIQRVDNPHPLSALPVSSIWRFFTQHGIVRPVLRQASRNPILRSRVTGVPKVTATQQTYISHTLQNLASALS